MKTIEELRKLMKDKRYSGSITERDAEFIRMVEDGFKALFPLRECHAEKIPEVIRLEREAREAQLDTSRRAIEETKAQIATLEGTTEKIEQAGNLKKLRDHLMLLEQSKAYLDVLQGRAFMISQKAAEANQRYREALERTHDCYGCKHLVQERQIMLCNHGYDRGKPAIPTLEIEACPSPSGQQLDKDRPMKIGRAHV